MTPRSKQRKLFNPFRGTVYHNRGGYGHIFRVPETAIVVKIAHRVVNSTAREEARAAENLEILRRERVVYEALATKSPHPNIVHYFLSTDIAIFLKFEPDNLERRLSRHLETPISEEWQFCWIQEIASAATWLETLDYFHGDLRQKTFFWMRPSMSRSATSGAPRSADARSRWPRTLSIDQAWTRSPDLYMNSSRSVPASTLFAPGKCHMASTRRLKSSS